MVTLELPYPPSVNHYYRTVGGKVLISDEGRRYRKSVATLTALYGVQPILGDLEVTLRVWPPDRKRRDLDNVQKALLDALQHGGVYPDDAHIVRLVADKLPPRKGGGVEVTVRRMDGGTVQN